MSMELHFDNNMTPEERAAFVSQVGEYPAYQPFVIDVLNTSKTKNNRDYTEAIKMANAYIDGVGSMYGEFYTKEIHSSLTRYIVTSVSDAALTIHKMFMEEDSDGCKIKAKITPSEKLMGMIKQAVPIKFAIRGLADDKDKDFLRILAVDVYPHYGQ